MRYAWILLIVVAAAAAAWLMPKQAASPHAPTVSAGGSTFVVEVAQTEAARELGLGGRDSLAAGHGMLFVFETPGRWGFWMKDTRIPLDMVWARADGTVISVARDVATSTYTEVPPKVLYPDTPDALYVLEVNAGAAAGIEPGQRMTISL